MVAHNGVLFDVPFLMDSLSLYKVSLIVLNMSNQIYILLLEKHAVRTGNLISTENISWLQYTHTLQGRILVMTHTGPQWILKRQLKYWN